MLVTFVLIGCSPSPSGQYQFETPDGPASVGPVHQTKYLITSEHARTAVTYSIDAPVKIRAPVDILILFDRTASMKDVIDTTANAANKIVQDIQFNAPNTRFAVASVADYSPMFTDDPDKRTWLLNTDFTLSPKQVEHAAKDIKLTNGGDIAEAYSRGLFEASELNWRKSAKKIIIFFGDSTDHSVDPGRDETMGTPDDLTMELVLSKLKESQIMVIGIHTKNETEVINTFEKISTQTGGQSISLQNAEASSQVVIDSIRNTLSKPAELVTNTAYNSWIKTNSEVLSNSSHTVYHINIDVPANTPAGVYEIPLRFNSGSGKDILSNALKDKPLTIKVITGWYNYPLILWLPLVLFLVYLIWSGFSMIKGGYSQTRSVTSKYKYDTNGYTLTHMMVDILTFVCLATSALALYLCTNNLVLSQVLNKL